MIRPSFDASSSSIVGVDVDFDAVGPGLCAPRRGTYDVVISAWLNDAASRYMLVWSSHCGHIRNDM